MNQYGETIQLRGLSADNGRGIESLTHKYYNKESLSSLKDWGANVFRIPVDTDEYYNGYVSDPNIINRVFEIADICIDFDDSYIEDKNTRMESMRTDAQTFSDIPEFTIRYIEERLNVSREEALKVYEGQVQEDDPEVED